jgi:predicted nucleic acid-binding protein
MARRDHSPARKKTASGGAFVLDASVTLAWFFEDETDAYAERVEDSLERATAVVPTLWHLEVTNALLVGERRGRTTELKTTQFVHLLSALPIATDEQPETESRDGVLSLARRHGLSAYDAAYLELALRRGLPLATLDRCLREAAEAAGVSLHAG